MVQPSVSRPWPAIHEQAKMGEIMLLRSITSRLRSIANEYLADDTAEEIINRLAAFRYLHVIARTSSFALKGSGFDIPRLSDVLGVRYLLQGSVREERNKVRILAQLIDESGRQLWSDSYDRELKEIFQTQREIAQAVAENIAPHVSTQRPKDSAKDIEAYQHYLLGGETSVQPLHRRGKTGTFLILFIRMA